MALEEPARSVGEQQGIAIANPRYPLLEDELHPLAALLASGHLFDHPSAHYAIQSQQPQPVDAGRQDQLCRAARAALPQRCTAEVGEPYSSTRNLTQLALSAYAAARQRGESSCALVNYCCRRASCPEVLFQRIVLELLEAE